MSTNCPVISTQKNLKENQLHGSHDFPVDIHMDYFPVSESGEHTLYVPMHWHPEVEFHYQLQGSVRIQVELTEYVLHPERCSGSMPNSCTIVILWEMKPQYRIPLSSTLLLSMVPSLMFFSENT